MYISDLIHNLYSWLPANLQILVYSFAGILIFALFVSFVFWILRLIRGG